MNAGLDIGLPDRILKLHRRSHAQRGRDVPLATMLVATCILVHDPLPVFLMSVGTHQRPNLILSLTLEHCKAGAGAGEQPFLSGSRVMIAAHIVKVEIDHPGWVRAVYRNEQTPTVCHLR